MNELRFVFIGLSITSSWGNGHATTYRALIRELAARGHDVLFLERDVPWYENNRDLPDPPYCRTRLYSSLEELKDSYAADVAHADMVIVGSYVPEGLEIGNWVCDTAGSKTAFYDIDTPVTLARILRDDCEYLSPQLIPRYDLYLSFSGGETLKKLEKVYGARSAKPLYCSVDTRAYYVGDCDPEYDLGYLGTYSDDRQPPLQRMLIDAAAAWPKGRFIVAGPQYPETILWPDNVERKDHVSPAEHRDFYTGQRFTLNVTRADMKRAGHSPSVRLFEAAACGVPIISDYWKGLEDFFDLQREILISRSPEETLEYLRTMPESARRKTARKAREKILARHSAAHRALELEEYALEILAKGRAQEVQA